VYWFLNAGQKLLHHWGRGHDSITWWLQWPTCLADLCKRLFFLPKGFSHLCGLSWLWQ
jgi:hypothetical protein